MIDKFKKFFKKNKNTNIEEKYYYETSRNKFDNVYCVEECQVESKIFLPGTKYTNNVKIGSESCTRCENYINGGFDKIIEDGWIKCKKINDAIKK